MAHERPEYEDSFDYFDPVYFKRIKELKLYIVKGRLSEFFPDQNDPLWISMNDHDLKIIEELGGFLKVFSFDQLDLILKLLLIDRRTMQLSKPSLELQDFFNRLKEFLAVYRQSSATKKRSSEEGSEPSLQDEEKITELTDVELLEHELFPEYKALQLLMDTNSSLDSIRKELELLSQIDPNYLDNEHLIYLAIMWRRNAGNEMRQGNTLKQLLQKFFETIDLKRKNLQEGLQKLYEEATEDERPADEGPGQEIWDGIEHQEDSAPDDEKGDDDDFLGRKPYDPLKDLPHE